MSNNNTRPYVHLDADHAGSILTLLAEYHTYVMKAIQLGGIFTMESAAEQCYLIGNIEGRCLHNDLTQDDLAILENWEEELDDWKALVGHYESFIREVTRL